MIAKTNFTQVKRDVHHSNGGDFLEHLFSCVCFTVKYILTYKEVSACFVGISNYGIGVSDLPMQIML